MAVHPSNRKATGFTLFELIIAMAMLMLLTGIGIPSFDTLISNTASNKAVSDLLGIINYSRNHAVTLGRSVSLCPSDNQLDCSNDWSDPIIIFEDTDENGEPDDGNIILVRDPSFSNTNVVWRGALGKNKYVTYRDNGSIVFSGRFAFCPQNSANKKPRRQVIIYRSGRARIAREGELKDYC